MEKLKTFLQFISLGKYHTVFHSAKLKSSVRSSMVGGIASVVLFVGLLVIGILTFIEIFNKVNRNVQVRTRELNAYKYDINNDFMTDDLVQCTNPLGCIDIKTEDIVQSLYLSQYIVVIEAPV